MSDGDSENHVVLTGRVSSTPERRELPSGDVLVTFRLVVDRDEKRARPAAKVGGRSPRSDWFDCAVWSSRLATRVLTWSVGDQVEVEGALRRRYFRSAAMSSAGTRVEVEVIQARKPRRSAPVSAAPS